MDSNFLPNTKCPYCGKWNVSAISGFGSELELREKQCRHCKKEFRLVVFSFSENMEETDPVSDIRILKQKIKYLKEQKKKTCQQILIEYDNAKRLNDEAMEIARKMRQRNDLN